MLPLTVQKLVAKEEAEISKKTGSEADIKTLMRKQGCSESYIEKVFTPASDKLDALSVAENTPFYEFYSRIKSPPLGRGEELNALDEIMGEKESQFHSDEYPGIYDRFLQISSIEGEGSYFYEVATGIVFSANWGEEEAMMDGTLERKWPSFFAFLEWYYPDTNDQTATEPSNGDR